MKKRISPITIFIISSILATQLFAYFLGQQVPLNFNYSYWNKDQSFTSFEDINDNWICEDKADVCTCDYFGNNAHCYTLDENNNTIDLKDTYKQEKFNSLTIVDINDTFSELDSFDGYDRNGNTINSFSGHPVSVSQGFYIVFGSSYARAATAQETQDTDDFLTGLRDSTNLDGGEVVGDFNDTEYTAPDNMNDTVGGIDGELDPNQDTSTEIANKLGIDSGEMDSLQSDLDRLDDNLYTETDGIKKFITSGVGGIDFGDINASAFLGDYLSSGATDKILGQLGLSGSINCYVKPANYKIQTKFNIIDTQICVFKDGHMQKKDFSELFGGAFGTEELGAPKCPLEGESFYDPGTDMCTGCDDPNAFWDKQNHLCKSCDSGQTYDSELDVCVDDEFTLDALGESEPQGFDYDYFWIARCAKRSEAATIVYTGKEEHAPPGGLQCGVYANSPILDLTYDDEAPIGTIPRCSGNYSNKCAWREYNKQFIYSSLTKIRDISPFPYKNEDFVLDYRINNFTLGALWGNNERRDNWNYGLIYFYRKYTDVIPMPYTTKLNFHGWTPLRSKSKEQSGVFSSFKEVDMNWTRADEKYLSTITVSASDITERMFICNGDQFVWWSDKSEETGKNVSLLNINTCKQKPEEGWNALLDKSHLEHYDSKYTLDHSLDVGEIKIKYGIYDSAHPTDGSGGHADAVYAHRKIYASIGVAPKTVPVEWGGEHRDIGCDLSVNLPQIPNVCVTIKASAEIKADPFDSNSPVIGKNVNMSPTQNIVANYADATSELSSENIVKDEDNATVYPSGITKENLAKGTDINNIFKNEDRANSPFGNALIEDNSEVVELVKTYLKTKQGGDNSHFIGTPYPNAIGNAITKIRPDYLGLPKNINDAENAITSITKDLSEEYSILNFEQNTLIYLNTQFAEAEAIPTITKPVEIEMMEQKIFKKFVESNSTTEAKALIEKRNAEKYIAIKTISKGNRLSSTTMQRLPALDVSDRLPYIAAAHKQMLKDAYISSVFSRIGRFKNSVFDMSITASRINGRPVYGKIMADNLKDAVKWSEDKIR